MCLKTYKIQINGRVQGVGFRPFIFNLAKRFNFSGSVSNNEKGVVIYVNASFEKVKLFIEKILKEKPEVSIITSHFFEEISHKEYHSFNIIPSDTNEQINIPLTPDFAICDICKNEMNDNNNRRYNYAFTTCVHCGPRYAITTKFPFERENTSLTDFEMCTSCKLEYKDPSNRRFHSQTNSCSKCGITLRLIDANENIIEDNQLKIIKTIVQLISKGKIIALKNINGYLLCCDATNTKTIKQLREKKQRPSKPFAVLYNSMKSIKKDFKVTEIEENALHSRVTPIVILQNTKNTKIVVDAIAPNLYQTGVMLPSSSLLELIMKEFKKPMIATSGNIHGSPILSDEKEAQEKLKDIADYFLHHNLEIEFSQDDSVLKFVNDKRIILRRSRGLAPNYLEINIDVAEPVLAMGAHLKSTFAFIPNQHTYVSQYFGNLDTYEVSERYKKTISKYTVLFNTLAKTILVDKHPQYQSTILGKELADKWNANLIEIQHHKAHFCSVLGEHNLFGTNDKILGVVWDGTGFGEDNNIWGGEFFTYQNRRIERLTHFEYFDWIANDKMAKEPRLALLSLLNEDDRYLIKNKFSEIEWKVYLKTIKTNTLKTSSVGRLFDAVASALEIVDVNSYEAEAAMLLENCASLSNNNDCIDLLEFRNYDEVPSQLLIRIILKAYKEDGVSKAIIARSFIFTLANIVITIANKNKVEIISCSGGVFQNSLLIEMLLSLTKKENIDLKFNRKLSANDENISFGQLMYYQNIEN